MNKETINKIGNYLISIESDRRMADLVCDTSVPRRGLIEIKDGMRVVPIRVNKFIDSQNNFQTEALALSQAVCQPVLIRYGSHKDVNDLIQEDEFTVMNINYHLVDSPDYNNLFNEGHLFFGLTEEELQEEVNAKFEELSRLYLQQYPAEE